MEIRHLIYFKTLAETLHFGKAAERLFISQPPLSRQIKDLENELGAILFLRNNKRVELTDAGQYFRTQVDELIQQLEHAKNITRQIHLHVSGDFKLGYITSTSKSMLAHVLKKIEIAYPYLRVHLYETSTQKQKLALENGKLDLGILRMPVFSNQLEVQTLFQDQLCIIGAENTVMDLVTFRKSNFICFNQQYAPDYQQLVINTCKRLGFEPNVVHQCNTMQSIIELVANGIGLAVIPQSFLQEKYEGKFSIYPVDKNIASTETILSYHKDNQSAVLLQIKDFIREEYSF